MLIKDGIAGAEGKILVMKKLVLFLARISQQRHLAAIRRGLSYNMPLIIIGSFAIVLNHLPFPWYQSFMLSTLGPAWNTLGQSIWNGTFAIISILLTLSVSNSLAERHPLVKSGAIHFYFTSIVSLSCLMVITEPFTGMGISGIPVRWTGTHGLFIAILVALCATDLFLYLCSIQKGTIRLFCDEADSAISQSMTCMLPAAGTIIIFALMKWGTASMGIMDIHQQIYLGIEHLFSCKTNDLGAAILFIGLVHGFWFVGMHGNNMMEPIAQNLYVSAAQSNATLAAAGLQPTEIFTKPFFDCFILLGGAGATLCLILAMLIAAKRNNTRSLAELSLFTAVCNVNELLLFGLPIIMNPLYLIPFLLTPLVLTLTSYAATAAGFVPVTIAEVEWTTPPLLGGYLTTGSWSGTALQVFNIFIGAIIYIPFVKLAEAQKTQETKAALVDLLGQIEDEKAIISKKLIARHDSVGNLARILAQDLKKALVEDKLVLEYQPQVNDKGRVFGVEALLRWPHAVYGRIPPPVIIAIAEEAGLIREVGKWVLAHACLQLETWKQTGINNLRMSVNASVMQVRNGSLATDVAMAIQFHGLSPGELEVEITENFALCCNRTTAEVFEQLHALGARIAIDDFGDGYSSIQYLKTFSIDTLKIDRSLSIGVDEHKGTQEVIASIAALCASLQIEIIVEYVESERQRNILQQLGCSQFQGYLYSAALPASAAADYIRQWNLR